MLMQPDKRLAGRVAPDVFAGHQPGGSGVGGRQTRLQLDDLGLHVDGDNERRCDDGVLAGCDAAEVDQRHRELVRGDQRAIVSGRLKPRCAARCRADRPLAEVSFVPARRTSSAYGPKRPRNGRSSGPRC